MIKNLRNRKPYESIEYDRIGPGTKLRIRNIGDYVDDGFIYRIKPELRKINNIRYPSNIHMSREKSKLCGHVVTVIRCDIEHNWLAVSVDNDEFWFYLSFNDIDEVINY